MAKQDEYIEEAYDELKKLSADEKKRLEYEARERAVLDYNTQMKSARMEGEQHGRRQAQAEIVGKLSARGMSRKEIAELLEVDPRSDGWVQGLRAGDIITAVDGRPVTGVQDLSRIRQGLGPGDTVSLTYLRDGASHTVEMALTDEAELS